MLTISSGKIFVGKQCSPNARSPAIQQRNPLSLQAISLHNATKVKQLLMMTTNLTYCHIICITGSIIYLSIGQFGAHHNTLCLSPQIFPVSLRTYKDPKRKQEQCLCKIWEDKLSYYGIFQNSLFGHRISILRTIESYSPYHNSTNLKKEDYC